MKSIPLVCFLCFGASSLWSQESAILSGAILDSGDALVAGAAVSLREINRDFTRATQTDSLGTWLFESLPPGDYQVEVAKAGFSRLVVDRISLGPRSRQSLQLRLTVSTVSNSITVDGSLLSISSDPSTGASIGEHSLRHLPVNGRSVDALIRATPGMVDGAGPAGGFNSNGLRSDMNYYTLDGVSLAAIPLATQVDAPEQVASIVESRTGGTGQATLDSLREVNVQTSTFTPEFGHTPGAQVAMTSRGGASAFHGSVFEYYRNERFNANDWFANSVGLERTKMRQNQFGGTLGGPILRNRTFFFVSYEGLRLLEPATAIVSVPDLATRASASSALRPYLDAFPLPNGPALSDGAARFAGVFSNSSERDSGSIRLDHAFNSKHSGFLRYSYAPGSGTYRGSDLLSPNVVSGYHLKSQSLTAAYVATPNASVTNDLRVNVTSSGYDSNSYMDGYGGAIPLTDALVFPAGIDSSTGQFNLTVLGMAGLTYSQGSRSRQVQINAVDGLAIVAGSHQYKIGVDYRFIAPTIGRKPYSSTAVFDGLSGRYNSLLWGTAAAAVINSNVTGVYPAYHNFGIYIQDTYQASAATTLVYGIRWDVNPAPGVRQGPQPFALSSDFSNRVTQTEPLYDTRWSDLSPQVGMTHIVKQTPGRELSFRGGAGVFHDTGYGLTAAAFDGAPYVNVRTLSPVYFPLSAENAAPPGATESRPYGQVSAAQRNLQSPMAYHWNATLERQFGDAQVVSVAYVGTRGRKLLGISVDPSPYTDDYLILRQTTSYAKSDYHALQVQLRRRLARNLQAQLSYTWGHSIDTASTTPITGFATLYALERGNSDFDVRHHLTFAGSYGLPAPQLPVLHAILRDWWTDWMVTWRTGMPFDVQGVTSAQSSSTVFGLFSQARPDLTGLPVWIDDANAPGGRRLNPAAFSLPDGYAQGIVDRNAFTGLGATQVDFSLRRELRLTERLRLHLGAQAFNLFNTPSFANLSPNGTANLSSPDFGIATGSAYRPGGPRSLQFSARLQF